MSVWQAVKFLLCEAKKQALLRNPYKIIRCDIDALTHKALFSLKIKNTDCLVKLGTHELLNSSDYIANLSKEDRENVERQYRKELNQPRAYIEEFPIHENHKGEWIYKIFILDSGKISVGTASYFIKKRSDITKLLSTNDLFSLTLGYFQENYIENKEAPKEKTSNILQISHE